MPEVVFLIEKPRFRDADVEEGEHRAFAYMRRGDPTLTLELDCSRGLSLRLQRAATRGNEPRGNEPRGNEPRGNEPRGNERPRGPRGNRLMNIIGIELHNRRADLVLLEVADI
jgi:hypothetical protein